MTRLAFPRLCFAILLALIATAKPISAAQNAPGLLAIQFSAPPDNTTEIHLTLERWTPFKASVDAASGRMTMEFPSLARAGTLVGQNAGLIRSYREEHSSTGSARLVFDLMQGAVIVRARETPGESGGPAHAVITLAPGDAIAVRATSDLSFGPDGAMAEAPNRQPVERYAPPHQLTIRAPDAPVPTAKPTLPNTEIPALASVRAGPAALPPMVRTPSASAQTQHISPGLFGKRTIVIDPGHGGIDPGAESVAGFHEKEVTLATARVLKRVLEDTGRYNVVLTRDQDIYLKLHERVIRARAAHGDLFVSLHADSVAGGEGSARGASVYTLSETASDAESERYAQRENRADAIGGMTLADKSDDVAGILVDLTVRQTVNDCNRFANMLVASLDHNGIALFPRLPHRSAGFAVLKSPDIPSVLIEMGYLSEIADARALADSRHQLQMAKAIAEGIDRYFDWVRMARS
jgi:N-acetylmuramoyl-L-alanine amidase